MFCEEQKFCPCQGDLKAIELEELMESLHQPRLYKQLRKPQSSVARWENGTHCWRLPRC